MEVSRVHLSRWKWEALINISEDIVSAYRKAIRKNVMFSLNKKMGLITKFVDIKIVNNKQLSYYKNYYDNLKF